MADDFSSRLQQAAANETEKLGQERDKASAARTKADAEAQQRTDALEGFFRAVVPTRLTDFAAVVGGTIAEDRKAVPPSTWTTCTSRVPMGAFDVLATVEPRSDGFVLTVAATLMSRRSGSEHKKIMQEHAHFLGAEPAKAGTWLENQLEKCVRAHVREMAER